MVLRLCRPKPSVDPKLVWLLARSPESRSDIVLLASGIGRTRVAWENVRDLTLALPTAKTAKLASKLVSKAEELGSKAIASRQKAEQAIYKELGLDNGVAWALINAFKPPK